ncbi:unnamed protein product [Cunninghamella echinulata]
MARHHHHHHHHENGNGHVKHSESNGHATKENNTTTNTTTITEKKQQQQTKTRFVSRVTSFPLVSDSVSTVSNLANKTYIGRFAINTANSTLSTVGKYTSQQPAYVQTYYESYVQPHLEKADQLGCKSLDLLETRFPVVKEPTSKLVDVVRQPSAQVIDGVKERLDTTITTVKLPATYANKRLVTVVSGVEALVDKYLPAQDQPSKDEKNRDIKKEGEEKKNIDEMNQVYRAYGVLNQATARLTQKVTTQVKTTASAIPKSTNDLAQSQYTKVSALIQTTTDNLKSVQATLTQSITVYAEATSKKLPPGVQEKITKLHLSTTERLQGLTSQVNVQLNQVVTFVKSSSQPPEWLKARVLSLVDIANHQFELVRAEYTRTDIAYSEKAKNVAHGLQNQVLPILQNIQSQLTHYSQLAREKAEADLKVPLGYLGLNVSNAAPLKA